MTDEQPTAEATTSRPVESVPTLRFEIPDADAPGFLYRQREAMRYREALRLSPSVEAMDQMIGFLLTFVAEPADRGQARALLLDLSRNDYLDLLQAVNQEDASFLPSARTSRPNSPRGTPGKPGSRRRGSSS